MLFCAFSTIFFKISTCHDQFSHKANLTENNNFTAEKNLLFPQKIGKDTNLGQADEFRVFIASLGKVSIKKKTLKVMEFSILGGV